MAADNTFALNQKDFPRMDRAIALFDAAFKLHAVCVLVSVSWGILSFADFKTTLRAIFDKVFNSLPEATLCLEVVLLFFQLTIYYRHY